MDSIDKLTARIEELERLFAILKKDPQSSAWREIQIALAVGRSGPAEEKSGAQERAFVRGGYGEEMDVTCGAITSFFCSLPAWKQRDVNSDEVVYLAGFFAFLALASSPTSPMRQGEAAIGAKATVARRLMVHKETAGRLDSCLRLFKSRLTEYSALWAGVLKREKSFGAFALRAFENVRAGERTRDGFAEHMTLFPDFCEERIKAFHSGSGAKAGTPDGGPHVQLTPDP